MNKVNSKWIETQHTTFTNWCNMTIRKNQDRSNQFVEMDDLVTGLKSGVNLIYLAEQLSKKKCLRFKDKPTMQIQCVGNIQEALDMFSKDGVRIVNISAKEIYDGNLKLLLGLMWSIIRHYESQVLLPKEEPQQTAQPIPVAANKREKPALPVKEEPESSHKKRLLNWVRDTTGRDAKNFTTDFSDGIILSELLRRFQTQYNMPLLDIHDNDSPTLRTAKAMESARDIFHIPLLMKPIDVVHNPDELSMMTYLICMKGTLQEFEEKWVDQQMEEERIRMENMNFDQNQQQQQQQQYQSYQQTEEVETKKNVKLPPVPPQLKKTTQSSYQHQQSEYVDTNQQQYPDQNDRYATDYYEYPEYCEQDFQQQNWNPHEAEMQRTQQQFEDTLAADRNRYQRQQVSTTSHYNHGSGYGSAAAYGLSSSGGSSYSVSTSSSGGYSSTIIPGSQTVVSSHVGFGFPFFPTSRVVTTRRIVAQPVIVPGNTVIVKKTVTKRSSLF